MDAISVPPVQITPPPPDITPPPKSTNKLFFVIGGLVILLIGLSGGFLILKSSSTEKPKTNPIGKGCTQEAKLCPDGSSVGRTGPNCEFAPCPQLTSTPTPIPNLSIESSQSATANWKTYTNTKWNYSFSYPDSFFVAEQEENICPTDDPLPLPSNYIPRTGACDNREKGDEVILYNIKDKNKQFYEIDTNLTIHITNKPPNYQVFPIDSECQTLNTDTYSTEYDIKEINLGNEKLYEIFMHEISTNPKKISPEKEFYRLYIKQNYKIDNNRPGIWLCGMIKEWVRSDQLINISVKTDNKTLLPDLRQILSTIKFL